MCERCFGSSPTAVPVYSIDGYSRNPPEGRANAEDENDHDH